VDLPGPVAKSGVGHHSLSLGWSSVPSRLVDRVRRQSFETLAIRLFRDRVDGTHAEAPGRQAVREVLAPILTFVSFMTSR
jgi:hypothetical protein